MGGDPKFRTDLYRGTAPFYDRYRPPYPRALLQSLRERVPISGSGRLLDLSCGTGQIAFSLSEHFAEIWAVDQEGESVEYGRAKADGLGVEHITWVCGRAETVRLDGPFTLVAIGNAFHRLDRRLVAKRAHSWLEPSGVIALLWSPIPWHGELPWQTTLAEMVVEWMTKAGATDRVPADWEAAIERNPHGQVLSRAGFDYEGELEFEVEQVWTPETIKGFLYSTSFLSREALGSKLPEFEKDLAERLLSCEPEGTFHESGAFALEFATKPG